MARQYYYLVAGLRDLTLDGEQKGFSAREIIDQISGELSGRDLAALTLLYNYYDIENIINIRNCQQRFSQLGTFSHAELQEQICRPDRLPKYMARVIEAFDRPDDCEYEDMELSDKFEHALYESYYDECAKSKSHFVRSWAEFDRNLRNVMAAYTARTKSIPMDSVVVGRDYITDHLKRNSAIDFGLKGELEYIDRVISAISDEENLVEKERRIDDLRWEMSDELSTFSYFDINTILAYLVKVNIIHRWISLDQVKGRQMLDQLIVSMSAKELIAQGAE